MQNECWGIILAAGQGRRMAEATGGEAKQFLPEETVNNPVAYPDNEILQNGVSFAFLPPEISRYVESLFMGVRNS